MTTRPKITLVAVVGLALVALAGWLVIRGLGGRSVDLSKVTKGMTRHQVVNVLGEPFRSFTPREPPTKDFVTAYGGSSSDITGELVVYVLSKAHGYGVDFNPGKETTLWIYFGRNGEVEERQLGVKK